MYFSFPTICHIACRYGAPVPETRVFTQLEIEYRIRGVDVDQAAVERAIELSETKYCPAQAMLGEVVPINIKFTIEAEN